VTSSEALSTYHDALISSFFSSLPSPFYSYLYYYLIAVRCPSCL